MNFAIPEFIMYNIKRIKDTNSVFSSLIKVLDQSNFDLVYQTCHRRCFFRVLIYLISCSITPELADVENADLTGFFVKNTKKSANFT